MKTTDLYDQFSAQVNVADSIGFRHFGGRKSFWGQIATVKCFEDNSIVRTTLEKNGQGKVLVVDGGGSLRCALLGDNIAALAYDNGWAGVIIYGAIRDSNDVATVDVGVLAMGTNPRKSAKNNKGTVDALVHFAGINFVPGDYVYVDTDGIVTSKTKLVTE